LVDKSIVTEKSKKGYIYVGKIIQNIANGVKIGQKEQFLDGCNPFIEKNIILCEEFLEKIAKLPVNVAPYTLCTLQEARTRELPKIHEKIVSLLEYIAKSLRSYKLEKMIEPLVSIVADLGDVDVEILQVVEDKPKKGGIFG